MDIKLLHGGMKVFIDPRSIQTKKEHGFVDQMMPMLGTTQRIQSISIYYNEVKISGYNWSPEDISLPHKLKKTKPVKKHTLVLFNPEELVL
jgi:hypothetical protein